MSGRTSKLSYESYYGLVEPPFSLAPGLRFTYNSASHRTALADVRQSLERREGLIVVTGEVGTGKTVLCRSLVQDKTPGSIASLVLDPCLSAEEILENVLTDFGVMNEEIGSVGRLAPQVPRHQMLVLLQRFLASLIAKRGRAVIVIDEAQHLRPEVLEQIRLWSNFETNDTKLLQIVLAGQSELDDILRRPEMRQIQQRISRRCELTPLSPAEVEEYIDHRLWVARGFVIDQGGEAPPARVRFSPAAAAAVAAISGGIPRVVNLLCDRALEVGCERQAPHIDPSAVALAAERLNLAPAAAGPETPARRVWGRPRISRRVAWGASAALLLVSVPFAWRAIPASAAAPVVDARPAPPVETVPETLSSQQVLKVTVVSFTNEARASSIATSLARDGYPAFVRREARTGAHEVIVGPYVTDAAADAARRALASLGVEGRELDLDNDDAMFSADVKYAKPAPVQREPEAPRQTPVPREEPAPQADLRPAMDRLDQLAPFLMSAATSPSAPVLKALEESLTTLGDSVAVAEVPARSKDAHDLLTSAISVARTALKPEYDGDRAAQARQALVLLDRARAAL